jgi:hypothetical protein
MNWMNAVEDIVQRYSGNAAGPAAAPADAHEDFRKVAQTAPKEMVADGISEAFRSSQTPPFPEMLGNLFGHFDPNQRAGLLNQLLHSVGPGAAALPGLRSLGGLLQGGSVTPQQASQVSSDQVQQIAAHAEQRSPSIVDEVSAFCAQHPDVMKAAGGLAATIALQHMLKRR